MRTKTRISKVEEGKGISLSLHLFWLIITAIGWFLMSCVVGNAVFEKPEVQPSNLTQTIDLNVLIKSIDRNENAIWRLTYDYGKLRRDLYTEWTKGIRPK